MKHVSKNNRWALETNQPVKNCIMTAYSLTIFGADIPSAVGDYTDTGIGVFTRVENVDLKTLSVAPVKQDAFVRLIHFSLSNK